MPVRVAHVIGKMKGGGVESVVMNYYRHIDCSRYQFDILVDADSSRVPLSEIEELGGRVIKIPPYQHAFSYQRDLHELFEAERWPIVHSHVNAMSVFPLRAAKKAGVPVRIAHSHSTSGAGEYAKNAIKGLLKPFSNRYATNRIACSKYAGEWLFGKGSSFTLLPNAIDTSLFLPSDEARNKVRDSLGIDQSSFVVGHIGRFVKQKNHSFLLEVFSELKKLEPSALLVCAGEGPLLTATIDRAKELGLDDSVLFLGQYEKAYELYQAFDVFCLPSLYEGLPVVGVECQAAHVPMLASDAMTSETAFTSLVDFDHLSSSPGVWAEHLLEMRDRPFLPEDEEGVKAFDIAASSLQLQNLYDSLLEGIR